jgi:hypothetical protein
MDVRWERAQGAWQMDAYRAMKIHALRRLVCGYVAESGFDGRIAAITERVIITEFLAHADEGVDHHGSDEQLLAVGLTAEQIGEMRRLYKS